MMRLMMALLLVLVPTVALAKGECKEDKKKFCKDVIEAKGDVGDCLEKHFDELSEACKTKQHTKKPEGEKKHGARDNKATAPDGAAPQGAAQ